MQYHCIEYGATVSTVPRDVKGRPYRSERRREQAEQNRQRVLDAAAVLFIERGYDGTSIAAVAEGAGVSQEMVYARFGNKRALLGELVERAVRGGDPAPVPEQPGPQALAAVGDQREQLRLFAADIGGRLERAAPLVAVVGGAARSDPQLAELLARLHDHRLRNLRAFVDALTRNGPLRDDALETVWALTSPELHQLLRRVRGWEAERYREWLAGSLERLLLAT